MAQPTAGRALQVTLTLRPTAGKTPAEVAAALRDMADHLSTDFDDVDAEGNLREGVAHSLWSTDGQGNYDGETLGYWSVTN